MKMRMITASLAMLGSVAASLVVGQAAHADTTICEKYGATTIQGGKYVVINNNWGDDTQQCINVTSTGFRVTQASHNRPQNGAPGSYPAVYAGCHYANCSNGSGLPLQASNSQFNTVQTSVSMSYPGSGVYDAAYDIWFDPTPRRDGQNTGAEIMVWLNHTGSVQPVGSRVGTVNLAGGTWDVWFGNVGWNVISYVRTSSTSSINFAVRTFYDDVVNRGYGQRSWYLTSVQAGFEPWVGGTGLAVNNFSYSIGGTVPNPTPSPTLGTGGAIRGVGSGRCLDVTGGSATNGAQAQIWDCNGQANQQWTPTGSGELRVFGNKCLDVNGRGTADGTTVIIWDCSGQNNQQWRFNSDGTITAVGANKCLDVPNNATANGTKLAIWTCNGGSNQRWTRG
ncbi:lectin [Microbispora sp. NPDC049125]|uniref:lectin n=1 Tax=Microbispora sp. NPDC049125 TaxID=3154929 RepID=UPI003465AFE1